MPEALMRAKLVRIESHQGESGWHFAKSPDLRGLLVAEPTPEALHRAIPQAIVDLYAAADVEVIVTRLDEDFDHKSGWVAIPAALAQQALAARAQ